MKTFRKKKQMLSTDFTTFSCNENVNLDKLYFIYINFKQLFNDNIITMKTKNLFVKTTYEQAFTIFLKFFVSKLNNEVVNYGVSKAGIGRLFSHSSSLQGMCKAIRHTASSDNYLDIDIVNCHPVILLEYAKKNKLDISAFKEYTSNREICLDTLIGSTDKNGDIVDRDGAKMIVLSLINNSKVITQFEEGHCPKWLETMSKQFDNLMDFYLETDLGKTNMELAIKNKGALYYNLRGSAINYMYCTEENKILKCMINVCKKNKVVIGALCFDGLLIEKTGKVKELTLSMSRSVKRNLGYSVSIIEKEMDKCIDIPTGFVRDLDDCTKIAKDNTDKFELLKRLLDIPKKKRTKEQDNQITVIMSEITKKNIDTLTESALILSNKHTDNFVDYTLLKDECKVQIVKSGLGTGKSTATSNYIKNSDYTNIIVLTPRRSYARSARERLEHDTGLPFLCYLDSKKNIIEDPYVVIQAESLYRLQLNVGKTLIIMDEVEAFLSQLTSTKTHKEHHIRNVETFLELVKSSCKIIALDAFISNRTLQTFITLVGINNILFHEYTKKLKQRKATEIKLIENFIKSLVFDLEQGKKIFLFCSSNTKLLTTKKKVYKIDKKGEQKEDKIIHALLPAIREKFNDKVILEFHSKHVSFQLNNVNEQWREADLVAVTSTITVGCNFDLPNIFHKIYVFASASSQNLVRDIFQASYRVRHLIDEEMVYHIDEKHYGKNYTTNISEISNVLQNKHNSILKLFDDHKLKYPQETPKVIEFLAVFNIFERNISVMNIRSLFDKYLSDCNYIKLDEDIIFNEIEFDTFIDPQISYKDIPCITPSICKALIMKKKISPLLEMESLQIEKFHFQYLLLSVPEDVEESIWKIYSNFGKGKFRNISIEKGIQQGTITVSDIIDKESYAHLNNGDSLRMNIINTMLTWIGVSNTQEFGYSISHDKVNSLIKHFEENRSKIHIAFDMRDRTKGNYDVKNTVALINKVFERWGYSTMKSDKKRKLVGTKLVDNSSYILTPKGSDDIQVAQYIKPQEKFIDSKTHPMLMRKEDLLFITDKDLENIRLNRQ